MLNEYGTFAFNIMESRQGEQHARVEAGRRAECTREDPFLDITAISDEASFSGSTKSACLVKRTRPSRKGGMVSCTTSTVR